MKGTTLSLYEIAPTVGAISVSPIKNIFSCPMVMETTMFRLRGTKQSSRDAACHVQNRRGDFQSSSIRSNDFQSSNVVTTLAVDRHYLSGASPATTNTDVASRVPTEIDRNSTVVNDWKSPLRKE